MTQSDLFADEEAVQPTYKPDIEKVRSRLRRILGEVRAADAVAWEPTRVNLYRTIVPAMTHWLPDDEGIRWRSEFEAEIARLEDAA